jgi:flagellar motor protein MotB
VAYADCVTAMMAFFLVMWLCAHDQKTKKAVADYFSHPNTVMDGASRSPGTTGSVFDTASKGPVPHSDQVAGGKGRGIYSSRTTISRITRLVNDWLHAEEKLIRHWRGEAVKQRESARRESGPAEKSDAVERLASRQLAARLSQELSPVIASQVKGLHRDLLVEIMADINWPEIADDLMGY